MNSQDSRKVKASSATTTRFIAARKAGKNGSTRGRTLVPTVAQAKKAGRGAAQIDDDQKERRQRVDAKMRADPRQAKRQHDPPPAIPPLETE